MERAHIRTADLPQSHTLYEMPSIPVDPAVGGYSNQHEEGGDTAQQSHRQPQLEGRGDAAKT